MADTRQFLAGTRAAGDSGLLTYLVALIIGAASAVVATIVGLALGVLAQSFCTLLISLLYFDLRARDAARVA